jgi:hypothetical protein
MRTPNVRRQWHLPARLQQRKYIGRRCERYVIAPIAVERGDFGSVVIADGHAGTETQTARRLTEAKPNILRRPERRLRSHQQQLDLGTALRSGAQSSSEHSRIIKNQQVTGMEKPAELCNPRVLDVAAATIEYQQPGLIARCGRVLRDEIRRQVEMKAGQTCA